jgi:cytoskeletal protein RodZ
VAGVHAATDDVAAAIVGVVVVVGVGIVSVVVVGPKAKPYKRASVKSVVKSSTAEPTASEASVKSSTAEPTASEASMKATAVEAASAKATAVEAASAEAASVATAKAASVTTAAATTSVTAAATATTATSECGRRLNQVDGRQCEQGYNRFPHHASFLETMSLSGLGHFRSGIIRQAKQRSR